MIKNSHKPIRCRLIPALAVALLPAFGAHAHMVSTGVAPFYDGLSHLFATPVDLLCVLGVALVGGLGGVDRARHTLFLAAAAWGIGVPLGALLLTESNETPILFPAALIVLGLLTALDRRWPATAILIGSVALNGALAIHAGAGLFDQPDPVQRLFGMLTGVLLVLTLGCAFVAARPQNWQRIALRAAGSWLAAIGLLALAWQFRAPTPGL